MFLVLTVITIWCTLFWRWPALDHHFPPGDLSALGPVLLSPLSFAFFLIWMMCIFIRLGYFAAQRFQSVTSDRGDTRRRGIYWITILDIPLIIAGILLVAYGWREGQMAPLVLGAILTVGLLFHTGEQWFRAFLS